MKELKEVEEIIKNEGDLSEEIIELVSKNSDKYVEFYMFIEFDPLVVQIVQKRWLNELCSGREDKRIYAGFCSILSEHSFLIDKKTKEAYVEGFLKKFKDYKKSFILPEPATWELIRFFSKNEELLHEVKNLILEKDCNEKYLWRIIDAVENQKKE